MVSVAATRVVSVAAARVVSVAAARKRPRRSPSPSGAFLVTDASTASEREPADLRAA